MKSGGTPENWAAHRAPEPGRKFLPLGATSHRAQVSKGLVPQKPSPSAITGSFVSREPQSKPTPVLQLPDIYTTCPELRQFKPIMTLPDMTIHSPQPSLLAGESAPSSQHNKSSFDPNEAILKPHELGFVPQSEWPPQTLSLNELRQMYFTRRNGAARQFDFKLYNALCITKAFPEAFSHVGAKWVSNTVMKIDAQVIANLLGIHAVQGGLFHKQGNFSRHGFQHIYLQSIGPIKDDPECSDVDDYNKRLLVDTLNRFTRDGEYKFVSDSSEMSH